MSVRKIGLWFISTCCDFNLSIVQEEQTYSSCTYYVLATLHGVFSLNSADNFSFVS